VRAPCPRAIVSSTRVPYITRLGSTMSTQHPFAFGTWLRGRREAAGLTQEALAEQSGLQAKTIAALERGRRQRPYPAHHAGACGRVGA
jgi:DNA-binding XRE family transcriptional regulator